MLIIISTLFRINPSRGAMAFISVAPLRTSSTAPITRTSFQQQCPQFGTAKRPNGRASIIRCQSAMPSSAESLQQEAAANLAPRVIPDPLPALYVYDHCPFCIRVRYVLGMKNVKYDLNWLLNDDATTPTSLVGKKLVPIFQPLGPAGPAMPESLDICKLIDSDERYGSTGTIRDASSRTDISEVMDGIAMPLRRLTRIRFVFASGLPEFTFKDGRDAYIRNHPLEDPASYEENWERSGEWISDAQVGINQLDGLIYSKEFCTQGGVSYDDVVLFAKVRALTIIKGLVIPDRLKEYIEFQSARCEIPLYYEHAN